MEREPEEERLWEGRCETWPGSMWAVGIGAALLAGMLSGGTLVMVRSPWYHTTLYVGAGLGWLWYIAAWRSQHYRITSTTVERRWGVFFEHLELFRRGSDDHWRIDGSELQVWRQEKARKRELRLCGLVRPELAAEALARSGTPEGTAASRAALVRSYFAHPLFGPMFSVRSLLGLLALVAMLVGLGLACLALAGFSWRLVELLQSALVWFVLCGLSAALLLAFEARRKARREQWLRCPGLPPVCIVWPARRLADGRRGLLGLSRDALVFVPVRRSGFWAGILPQAVEQHPLDGLDLDAQFALGSPSMARPLFVARLEALAEIRPGSSAETPASGATGRSI